MVPDAVGDGVADDGEVDVLGVGLLDVGDEVELDGVGLGSELPDAVGLLVAPAADAVGLLVVPSVDTVGLGDAVSATTVPFIGADLNACVRRWTPDWLVPDWAAVT